MQHKTMLLRPPGLSPLRVAGIRLRIDGMAWCLLELIVNGESMWYGGPVEDGRLTPIIHDPDGIHRTYFRFHSSPGEQRYYLRMPVLATALTLHHESASGTAYTVCDVAPLAISPDDYMDALPSPRAHRHQRRYKPSRIAHSTPHN